MVFFICCLKRGVNPDNSNVKMSKKPLERLRDRFTDHREFSSLNAAFLCDVFVYLISLYSTKSGPEAFRVFSIKKKKKCYLQFSNKKNSGLVGKTLLL